MIYKDKSLLNDDNQFAYSNDDILYDELSESIENGRFYDFIVESVFDNDELTLESKYYFKREIINESMNARDNQMAKALGINSDNFKSIDDLVEKLKKLLKSCSKKLQDEKIKLDMASRSDQKGKISKIIDMIKKAIIWIKEKYYKFLDTVMDNKLIG